MLLNELVEDKPGLSPLAIKLLDLHRLLNWHTDPSKRQQWYAYIDPIMNDGKLGFGDLSDDQLHQAIKVAKDIIHKRS